MASITDNLTDSITGESGASRTITAFFDSCDDAQRALDRLDGLGLAPGSAKLVRGNEASAEADDNAHRGFWESLSDFFFPDDDRAAYAEGLRRGGFLVTARDIPADKYDEALDILDDEGSVDVDARSSEWRSEGWTGSSYGDGAPFERSAASASDLSMAGTGVGASAFTGGKLAGGSAGYDDGRDIASARAGTDTIRSGSLAARDASAGETDLGGVGGPAMSDARDRSLDRDEAVGSSAAPVASDTSGLSDFDGDLEPRSMRGRRDMETGRVRARSYSYETMSLSDAARDGTEVEVEDERGIAGRTSETGTRG